MMLLRGTFTFPLNTLTLCNHMIKWVTHARLLGVTIDNKLTRSHHIFEVLIFFWPGLKIYSDTHFHKKLQKIYGLWGYLLKPQALAPIKARRVLEGG